VGLESLRPLTHWVILTCFKRCLLYSHVPSLSRHEHRLVGGNHARPIPNAQNTKSNGSFIYHLNDEFAHRVGVGG
jgi:hypothetical protein